MIVRSLTVRQIPETRIIEDLKGAGRRGELVAHFQPQVALPGRRVVGVEALARWNHPEFGLLCPTDFIPAAESAGLMGELGHHMLEVAARQVVAWRAAGIHLDLSVNVSPSQLVDDGYCENVSAVLDRTGLPAAVLTLEITETHPIEDLAAVVECLEHVRELGVGVSIDDFGVGHSSLEQFRSLPASELKLDQSIIQGTVDGALALLAEVIIEARTRGLRIVAEGVETPDHLALAQQLGCDRAQGYLLGAPVDADALVRSLR
jgi:EAL domain-containing protein (putative c-di-GMP-specific phosphodiesterase class I)